MLASGAGTGGSSTPDSNEFVRGTSPEFTDELGELVPVLDSIHLVPYKKSSLVGSSSPFDPKKVKVTVQRPGDQKAYQCGPHLRKTKKTDSDAIKEINRCREENTTRLDLTKGQLHFLPPSIRDVAHHLKELYLYCNKLVNLPNEIGTLFALEILMVQENSLSDLPETLAQCTQLRVLDIRHNKLCEIPQVVYKLHNLTHLFLRFNRIRVVDEEIKYLTIMTSFGYHTTTIWSVNNSGANEMLKQ
ncbi:unnamed protein product [Schistosoma curassoni]|uniref:Leucine-rich repeat-containing protein 51 n=1 Tax=Schistosoma curassoni TaxID=6186 RepID=A0A183KAX2_9TREM|nr:unnamed protein product [Schistosoma curassoni]